MAGRTRILVTNAIQYLPKCDYIIMLDENTIVHQGTYAELKAANIDFLEISNEAQSSRMSSEAPALTTEKGKQ